MDFDLCHVLYKSKDPFPITNGLIWLIWYILKSWCLFLVCPEAIKPAWVEGWCKLAFDRDAWEAMELKHVARGSTCRLNCFGPFWMVNKKITKKRYQQVVAQTLFCKIVLLLSDLLLSIGTFSNTWQVGEAAFGISNLGLCGQGGPVEDQLYIVVHPWPQVGPLEAPTALLLGSGADVFFLFWWDSQESFQIRKCTAWQ